jgi:hypothetical protein
MLGNVTDDSDPDWSCIYGLFDSDGIPNVSSMYFDPEEILYR